MEERGQKIELVDRWLDRLIARDRVDGAGLGVARRGELVYERYIGEASPGVAASSETIWPLASISKVYSAATLTALIEAGETTLGTLVGKVIPGCVGDGREQITLRHLLTHSSGIPYESPVMPELMEDQTPLDRMVVDALTMPLLFPPGTDHTYSDLGYALAGEFASRLCATQFGALTGELVLEPAGLHNTFFTPPMDVYARIAMVRGAYAEGSDGAMYNSHYSRQLAHPAFGVYASLPDVMRFLDCFTAAPRRRLFSPAGVQLMSTDQSKGDAFFLAEGARRPNVLPYAIGFAVKSDGWTPDLSSPSGFGHGGATGCFVWVDPVYELSFAFVSNRHFNASTDEFLGRVIGVSNLVYAAFTG